VKAAVYRENGGPDVLTYEDVPDPTAGPGEVLIRVEAISIEGGDFLRRGRVPPTQVPRIEGYTAAGEVIAVGPGVHDFSVGEKVTSWAESGSHAELRAPRAEHCWRVPPGMDIKAAAVALIGLGTAVTALFEVGRIAAGETVLVQGAAGGVGLGAVQLAHAAGARVFGTGSSAASLEALRRYGLDEPLDTSRGSVAETVKELTGGHGVDLVIDNVGGPALQDGLDALTHGGRLVMVGTIGSANHSVDPFRLLLRNQTVGGFTLPFLMPRPQVRALIAKVLERVAAGELEAVIDRVYPLSEAAAAHRRAEERGRIGRVVMTPTP